MAKKVYYVQCELKKNIGDDMRVVKHALVPELIAKKNQRVRILEDDGWDYGWVVTEVYKHKTDSSNLPDNYKMIRGHRRSMGDSLPKGK